MDNACFLNTEIKMERQEVYKAIDSERDYQNTIWNGTKSSRQPSDAPNAMERTIDEFALYVARYTNQLIEVCGSTDYPERKLEVFRKIAALCVACGESHGMPKRATNMKYKCDTCFKEHELDESKVFNKQLYIPPKSCSEGDYYVDNYFWFQCCDCGRAIAVKKEDLMHPDQVKKDYSEHRGVCLSQQNKP